MTGRDPFYKCVKCGRFVSYLDFNNDKVHKKYGHEEDTLLEVIEIWHLDCKEKEQC